MSEEEINKIFNSIPKSKNTNSISAFNSIDIEDLKDAMKRLNEIPTFNSLLKENKQLKEQLQQSEEVIEECKQSIDNFMTHIDDGFCADMMTFIDILNKYEKKEESR